MEVWVRSSAPHKVVRTDPRALRIFAPMKKSSTKQKVTMSADATDLSANVPSVRLNEFLSTDRDRKIFAKALLHPPKPKATLRKAVKDYRAAVECG